MAPKKTNTIAPPRRSSRIAGRQKPNYNPNSAYKITKPKASKNKKASTGQKETEAVIAASEAQAQTVKDEEFSPLDDRQWKDVTGVPPTSSPVDLDEGPVSPELTKPHGPQRTVGIVKAEAIDQPEVEKLHDPIGLGIEYAHTGAPVTGMASESSLEQSQSSPAFSIAHEPEVESESPPLRAASGSPKTYSGTTQNVQLASPPASSMKTKREEVSPTEQLATSSSFLSSGDTASSSALELKHDTQLASPPVSSMKIKAEEVSPTELLGASASFPSSGDAESTSTLEHKIETLLGGASAQHLDDHYQPSHTTSDPKAITVLTFSDNESDSSEFKTDPPYSEIVLSPNTGAQPELSNSHEATSASTSVQPKTESLSPGIESSFLDGPRRETPESLPDYDERERELSDSASATTIASPPKTETQQAPSPFQDADIILPTPQPEQPLFASYANGIPGLGYLPQPEWTPQSPKYRSTSVLSSEASSDLEISPGSGRAAQRSSEARQEYELFGIGSAGSRT